MTINVTPPSRIKLIDSPNSTIPSSTAYAVWTGIGAAGIGGPDRQNLQNPAEQIDERGKQNER